MEILIWIAGVIVGAFLTWIFYRKPIGTILVDYSNPETGPFKLVLDSKDDLERIAKRKRVVFKVEDTNNYISPK